MCSEKFLIVNSEIHDFAHHFIKGRHTISYELKTEEGQIDFALEGIKIYNFCYGIHSISSFFKTSKCLIGGLPNYEELA